ncbi:Sterol regulatory element-binding protein [Lachnellula subtilissima]|uniref:Sterol regulatory element-binding protein n=1 Tax=Lachnellula subtilissima TaxID=602034 RepID=A0A8H8RY41_9HELO|nr:Sterol regulatory element-binding protein [Lachnellula subtilissima]
MQNHSLNNHPTLLSSYTSPNKCSLPSAHSVDMDSQSTLDPAVLSGMSPGFNALDGFDDTLAFTDPLEGDDPLFPVDWDQEDTPPYEGNLYSTPLNWDPPEAKVEPLPNAPYQTMPLNSLTPAQQEKLRNIAMPQHLQYRNQHSPASTHKSTSVSSPEANDNRRKRKSTSSADEEDDEDGEHPPVKKTAHNMIEKRYRTNLNDKIAALRDSVPSLRIMTKSARGEDTADDREELQGLTPAHKLNKATVLSKATEYIAHLEKRNKRLQEENVEQKARLAAFETLFRSGSMGFSPTPPMSNAFQYPSDYNTPSHSPVNDPQGMIQVPEDIRRLQRQSNQQTYPVGQYQELQQQGRQQQMGPNGWQNGGGGYFGKLMVGSLAGLMVMEGFTQAESESDEPGARGLFALPVHLLRTVAHYIHSSIDFNVLGYHLSASQFLGYFKFFLVFGALLYVFLPSLFATKPKSDGGKTQNSSIAAAPSLASSIQVRRQAWLTAVQTVWVPRNNFFLEAAALCLKMVKLSFRNAVGSDSYTYLTGINQQSETARVKTWGIALDAQLAGGDVEVSKSRLTLTLLASGTLPDTPARLMLKALHVRVLLWEIGNAGFNGFYMFHEIAAKLARWKWNEAKKLQRLMSSTEDKQDDELPGYLKALLEEECDDVLTDCISQRAYNLAWNLPTNNNVRVGYKGMDSVVDDYAIRSPLDAVAAWYSSLLCEQALSKSLESSSDDAVSQRSIIETIALAIKVAPIGSGAQIRAFVARAVLVKEKRGLNIAASLKALGPFQPKNSQSTTSAPSLIHTSTSIAGLPDIKMSLRCAMAIAHLERFPAPDNPTAAHPIINSVVPTNLTLLGFTAAFKLMESIQAHDMVAVSCTNALEKLAGNLRIWVGGKDGEQSGLDKDIRKEMVERCLGTTKRIIGMEKDAGYETMSEDETGEGC